MVEKKECSIGKVAQAVLGTRIGTQKLSLWPTEEALKREGLHFDKGGSHSRNCSDVIKTMNRLKANPSGNFSSSDKTKLCRRLNEILMAGDPYVLKIRTLQDLCHNLNLLLDSANKLIYYADENEDLSIKNSDDLNHTRMETGDAECCKMKERLMSAVEGVSSYLDSGFGTAASPPSHSEKLKKAEEILSKISSLQKQASEVEDDFFRSLEAHLASSPADTTQPKALALPTWANGARMLHVVYLIGLKMTGAKLVEKYFNTPELISLPVENDLDLWRIRPAGGSDDGWEDGLYTGQTLLHFAIVEEDLPFVRFLLARGASLICRARGVFFQPEAAPCIPAGPDGAPAVAGGPARRNDLSGCFFGDYPLSFAASLGRVDICAALCGEMRHRLAARPAAAPPRAPGARGSLWAEGDVRDMDDFLGAADSYGNTALHMAALYGRAEAVDWLVEQGGLGLLEAVNSDGLTPLTLAVRHGRADAYHHIIDRWMTETVWVYGRRCQRKTDLMQVFFPYLGLLACYAAVATVRPAAVRNGGPPGGLLGMAAASLLPGTCGVVRQAEEVGGQAAALALYLGGVPWLLRKAWGTRGGGLAQGLRDLDRDGDGGVSLQEVADFALTHAEGLLDTGAAFLLAGAATCRMGGMYRGEADCLAGAGVLLFANLLHVLAPFRFFGGLAVTMHKMLGADVPRFMALYLSMHTGFAFARLLLLRRYGSKDAEAAGGDEDVLASTAGAPGPSSGMGADFVGALFNPFWVAMGDGLSDVMDHSLLSESPTLLLSFHVAWIFLSNIVLINLLIAMMAKTFDENSSQVHALWFFPFASRVLLFERMLSDSDRDLFRAGTPTIWCCVDFVFMMSTVMYLGIASWEWEVEPAREHPRVVD